MQLIKFQDKSLLDEATLEQNVRYLEIGDYKITENGDFFNIKTNRKLKPSLNKLNGYYRVSLKIYGFKERGVHRIIAELFIPKPKMSQDTQLIVGHLDNDKSNNKVSNLYWTTVKENNQKYWDERRRGLYDDYESSPEQKLYRRKYQKKESFKKYQREYSKKYWKEHNYSKHKRYLEKINSDPILRQKFIEKEKARNKRRYAELKANPVRYKILIDNKREKRRQEKEKNKN